jgi:hypothetical protein
MDSLHMKIVVSKLPQPRRVSLDEYCREKECYLRVVQIRKDQWNVSVAVESCGREIAFISNPDPVAAASTLCSVLSAEGCSVYLSLADAAMIKEATK